jgi:hypothetical protein
MLYRTQQLSFLISRGANRVNPTCALSGANRANPTCTVGGLPCRRVSATPRGGVAALHHECSAAATNVTVRRSGECQVRCAGAAARGSRTFFRFHLRIKISLTQTGRALRWGYRNREAGNHGPSYRVLSHERTPNRLGDQNGLVDDRAAETTDGPRPLPGMRPEPRHRSQGWLSGAGRTWSTRFIRCALAVA